ncbi:MAG: hypothetical protein ABIW76_24555 [Fibrobacteria bacterium]
MPKKGRKKLRISEAKLDKFYPLDLPWWFTVSQDWEPEDKGPVLLVLVYLWTKGGRAPNDKKIIRASGVSLKVWEGITSRIGAFFRLDAGDLVQDALLTLYTSKSKTYVSNQVKAVNAINTRHERNRAKAALKKTADATPSNTPSTTWSNNLDATPSSTPSSTPGPVRAISSFLDLRSSLKPGEDPNARVMPMTPGEIDAEIAAAIAAYPKTRTTPEGKTVEVVIGESAAGLARAFLTANPHYPLTLAAKYTAKTGTRPRNWEKFIADPPAASVVLTAYERALKARAETRLKVSGESTPAPKELRGIVERIQAGATAAPEEMADLAPIARRIYAEA